MRGFDYGMIVCACAALFGLGCDGGDDPMDAGPGDSGPVCRMIPELREGTRPAPADVTCPTAVDQACTTDDECPHLYTCDTAAGQCAPVFPDDPMGTCCWRDSNADNLDAPEYRLTFIDIVGPAGAPLASTTVRRVLNEALQEETFNWLIRVENASADGTVNIVTGFGRHQADGTYEFSQGSASTNPVSGVADSDAWCPVEIPATLAGDVVNSDPIAGSITVPIFDDAGVDVQIELTLRNIAIEQSTWGEDRSCIGWKAAQPFTYFPQAVLSGYVEVEPSRAQVIMTPGVETNVCAALAGSLSLTYCDDNPQSAWMIKPDSFCDASGCTANPECVTPTVCNPDGSDAGGLPGCNAWRFVAHFAAAGVDITNDVCP